MKLFLVHHADAVGPGVDPQRPISNAGAADARRIAAEAATRGAKPSVIWHSGKLRAKQTAEIFWRACNALAELSATRDLQPDDAPIFMRDRMRGESRDVMLVGHYPHLPGLLALLLDADAASFPQHGIVALRTDNDGETWSEAWRISRAE